MEKKYTQEEVERLTSLQSKDCAFHVFDDHGFCTNCRKYMEKYDYKLQNLRRLIKRGPNLI